MQEYTSRATSEDIIQFQLKYKKAPQNPINITGISSIDLRLKRGSVLLNFKTTDTSQKLFITDAVNGKVELRPSGTDFVTAGIWEGFFWLYDAFGKRIAIAEGENFILTIMENF